MRFYLSNTNSCLVKGIRFLVTVLGIIVLFLSSVDEGLAASSFPLKDQNRQVVEYLRVSVPEVYKEIWLDVEKNSWEPWLEKKIGFLGRQVLWEKTTEEGVLLITWATRHDWKSISPEEIELVQQDFENLARKGTGQLKGNPFPLQYEGELLPL